MNTKKIISGGLSAGLTFYVVSLVVWKLLNFLPVVPLALAIPPQGLGQNWWIYHLLVLLFVGVMWAIGFCIYGKARVSGWLYGAVLYLAGLLPAFVAQFIISAPEVRTLVVYGAIVSFAGALLGGRVIAFAMKR